MISLLLALFTAFTHAEVNPKTIFFAEGSQKKTFIRDGLILGGDSSVDAIVVHDLRFANSGSYERLVLDLGGADAKNEPSISRPPYYQVELTPDMKRILVTVFGSPTLAFDPRKIKAMIAKSALVSGIDLMPVVEKDRWNFALHLKSGVQLEVFELKKPVRVVMDIKK